MRRNSLFLQQTECQLIDIEEMVEVKMYYFIVNLHILMDVYVGECSCLYELY